VSARRHARPTAAAAAAYAREAPALAAAAPRRVGNRDGCFGEALPRRHGVGRGRQRSVGVKPLCSHLCDACLHGWGRNAADGPRLPAGRCVGRSGCRLYCRAVGCRAGRYQRCCRHAAAGRRCAGSLVGRLAMGVRACGARSAGDVSRRLPVSRAVGGRSQWEVAPASHVTDWWGCQRPPAVACVVALLLPLSLIAPSWCVGLHLPLLLPFPRCIGLTFSLHGYSTPSPVVNRQVCRYGRPLGRGGSSRATSRPRGGSGAVAGQGVEVCKPVRWRGSDECTGRTWHKRASQTMSCNAGGVGASTRAEDRVSHRSCGGNRSKTVQVAQLVGWLWT